MGTKNYVLVYYDLYGSNQQVYFLWVMGQLGQNRCVSRTMDWWPDVPRRGACEVEYRGTVKVLARGKCEN